jgi:hypothetical protein
MEVDPDVVHDIEETANAAAQANTQLSNVRENLNNLSGEGPKSTFKMSQAIGEVSATLLNVGSLITSI